MEGEVSYDAFHNLYLNLKWLNILFAKNPI